MGISFGLLFAIILFLVSSIRTFGLPWTSDRGSYGDAEALVLKHLSLAADLKKALLMHWLEERESDAVGLSQNEVVTRSVKNLLRVVRKETGSEPSGDELRADSTRNDSGRALSKALEGFAESEKVYRKIQVADAQAGVVIASTVEKDLGVKVSDRSFLSNALRAPGQSSVVVTTSPGTGKPYLVISRAIVDKSSGEAAEAGRVLGVVILYIDEDRFLAPLLYTGGLVGDTEDVFLVTQDRRILTSPRYPLPDGTQAKPLEYRIEAEPATLAAEGKEGITISRDYRGVPVLAAYRYLKVTPDTGWGLVVKVDQDEILGPTRGRFLHASFISLLAVVLAAVMAAVIAGQIARPIQNLIRTARKVETGNLDARSMVHTSDEVGNLAATFNSMIERVQNWHEDLEAQVRNRTLLLAEVNEELVVEIAERKRAEERIRQQNDFLKSVLESLAHPFYVIDAADYTIKMANSAARSNQISDGSTCYSLTHGRNTPCSGGNHPCPVEEVRRTGQPVLAEHVHYDKAGGARYVEVHAYPIVDPAGNVVQVIEYALDITDRRRSEEERERLIGELEAKNAELERFTYTVSHDLKSPLITIKGFLGYLERDVAAGNLERLRADQARIHAAVEKMGLLLDELLELSRIGRIMNPPQDVALDRLVREAVDTLAGRIAERGVIVDIADDLPVLYGDAARLREVVENLLDNAVKFMGDQAHPRVEIGIRQESDQTVIFFKDNGIGVDNRYHDKIFGLFERLGPDTEGTGIGLAIVKRIIEVHGGRIWVESEGAGRGAVFAFTLPGRNGNKRGHG